MLRNPDRMSTEERDAEVAHLLGKALLRIHKAQKYKVATASTETATPPRGIDPPASAGDPPSGSDRP